MPIIFVYLVAAIIVSALPIMASEIVEFKLAWDANSEEDLDGYEIYAREGVSGSPYKLIGEVYVDELAEPDNPMVTITDLYNGVFAGPAIRMTELADNSTYYFALTAFDTQGNISDLSKELCVEITGSSAIECRSAANGGDSGGGGGCFIVTSSSGFGGAAEIFAIFSLFAFKLKKIFTTIKTNR